MKDHYNVLILGASYGSLFSTKLLLAGHSVTLVCTPPTAELINREGTLVRFPVRGRETFVEIYSDTLTGQLSASEPDAIDPTDFDLVVLGMQESQYSSPGVREMMARIAASRLPSLAIMNMPPLPYLARIPGLETDQLEDCFTEPSVWEGFESGLVSLASPDPQAFRPPEEPKNVLQVGLPTNFKAAHFEDDAHTQILRNLQADIESARYDPGQGAIEIPVKLKVHDSIFVPLAKWPMLLTGNYRCIGPDEMISISEAVYGDMETAKETYAWISKPSDITSTIF